MMSADMMKSTHMNTSTLKTTDCVDDPRSDSATSEIEVKNKNQQWDIQQKKKSVSNR